MYITRIAKIVMVTCLAVYCLLVAFNNLTDYGTNHLFVQRVLSMDTTFPGNKLMYRAVEHPSLWHAAYWTIIAGQLVAGVLFLAGAIRLWQVRAAPGEAFNGAKGLTVAGALAAFLVWFFLFMVIAGEWFAMWQSQTWNGQDAAFRFYMTALAVLIFVVLPDGDFEDATSVKTSSSAKTSSKQTPKTEAKASRKRSRGAAKKAGAKKPSGAKTGTTAAKLASTRDRLQEES